MGISQRERGQCHQEGEGSKAQQLFSGNKTCVLLGCVFSSRQMRSFPLASSFPGSPCPTVCDPVTRPHPGLVFKAPSRTVLIYVPVLPIPVGLGSTQMPPALPQTDNTSLIVFSPFCSVTCGRSRLHCHLVSKTVPAPCTGHWLTFPVSQAYHQTPLCPRHHGIVLLKYHMHAHTHTHTYTHIFPIYLPIYL